MTARRASSSRLIKASLASASSSRAQPAEHLAAADNVALGDIDAVKELADVLVLDVARLVDERSGERYVVDVVADHHDLVLDVFRARAGYPRVALDAADDLLAEEVPDLDDGVLLNDRDVDGEVGVHEPHLVLEALSDADDHVGHVRARGADRGRLLGGAEPLLDLDLAVGQLEDVDGHVLEALGQGAARALNRHLARLHDQCDAFRHTDRLRLVDHAHLGRRSVGRGEAFA
mmetsp:Transcript_3474/g.8684  ORF Transcript_3474/g.8684 Transcript_3474/m.8684 type:complete len:232 (+) Transcript_3474:102-797(+)